MRLGVNATFLNEMPAGVGFFTQEVSSRLCRFNKETALFAPYDIDGCHTIKTPNGISGSMRLLDNVKRFIYINTALPVLMKRMRLDVIYCPVAEFPFLPVSSKMVVSVHDLHPAYFPEQFGLSSLYFKYSLRFLRLLAKRVIVPSEFVKKELLNACSLDRNIIDVVYNGYDSNRFYPRPDDRKEAFLESFGIREPYILFVGSLFKYKNLKTLVSAFLNIKNKISHSLVVIGKKEVAKDCLVQDDKILYLDYVNNEDLPFFYSYADIFVHPAFFEGFGLAVVEAMACGAPVISSTGGSLPEICGDAAVFFDPNDSELLGRLLLEILADENLRRELSAKGFNNVKRFSWDNTAHAILKACKVASRTVK